MSGKKGRVLGGVLADRMSLTDNEFVRQVVLGMAQVEEPLKMWWLRRRGITRGARQTRRSFRVARRVVLPAIVSCVREMGALQSQGVLDRAESEYAQRVGPAAIDLIVDAAIRHKRQLEEFPTPITPRRTCSGYFGCTTTLDDVAFGEWER